MKLNKKNMLAAHFARIMDTDPNRPKSQSMEEFVRAEARALGTNPTADLEKYRLGKEVLAKYTLTYSSRFVRGTAPPEEPNNVVDKITVDSGYIATSEAVRYAMFKRR